MGNEFSEGMNLRVQHELTRHSDGDFDKTGQEAVLEALSRMNNNRKYSDLIIVCKNGVRKFGSRLWLSARSAELERIITNSSVTESGLSVISLPTISPGAMLIVLEFLHTGSPGAFLQRLESKFIRRLSRDVIGAAKRLHLPRLENMFWRILEWEGEHGLNLACIRDDEEKGKAEILETLARMSKIPRHSDVLIRSSNGVLVPASRLWLSAMCPVLGRLFGCKGASAGGQTFREKVTLNVSTEVLDILLDYLHTGSPRMFMQSLGDRKRWSAGLEAICLARHLKISLLEKFLWSFAMEDARKSTADPTDIELSVFRLAELRNFPYDFLSRSVVNCQDHIRNVERVATALVRIIDRGWMDSDHIRELSQEDFIYFLRKTRRKKNRLAPIDVTYRLEEYHRLRSIVRWCMWDPSWSTEVLPEVAIKFVSIFFSKAEYAKPLHSDNCSDSEREECFRLLRKDRRRIIQAQTIRKILKNICKLAKFERFFLPFVDLDIIHPALLTNLLKPWGLISPSVIQRALDRQTLRKCQLSDYVYADFR